MPIVSSSAQGTPSWLDLSTSDEAAAIEFYGNLFGWTNEPNDAGGGMMYNMQKQGDAYVGGIYKQRDEEAAQGIPPHWTTYISVDNVDEAVTRVAGAGGTGVYGAVRRDGSRPDGDLCRTHGRCCGVVAEQARYGRYADGRAKLPLLGRVDHRRSG